ncbi:MAG: peptidoglycan-binding domain-containing protein [Patescibacteria group bacterium]
MKNHKRGFAPVIIIFLVVAALGGGAYVYTNVNDKKEIKKTLINENPLNETPRTENIPSTSSPSPKTATTTVTATTTAKVKVTPPPVKKITISCAALKRNLVVGSVGDDVYELQRYLMDQGLLVRADYIQKGVYDEFTREAVARLHAKFSIVPTDLSIPQKVGNFENKTRAYLQNGCTNTQLVAAPPSQEKPFDAECLSSSAPATSIGIPCKQNLTTSASANVTVITPNGGEVYSIGSQIPVIRWKVPSPYNAIELVLMPMSGTNTNSPIYSAKLKGYGFGGYVPKQNSQSVVDRPMIMTENTIDQTIPPGQYKMRIYYYAEGQDYTEAEYLPLGYDDSDQSFTLIDAPEITEFRTSHEITSDIRSTTLVWKTTNAAFCTMSGPNFAANTSVEIESAVSTGNLNATSTYMLTCESKKGQKVSKSLTVFVSQ